MQRQREVRRRVASRKIMHTSPFVLVLVLVLVLSEAVLVLDRLSLSTSTNARQIELTISGSFQAAESM